MGALWTAREKVYPTQIALDTPHRIIYSRDMTRFTSYDEAYDAAVTMAQTVKTDVGILRVREYGRDGYNVALLPRPDCCFGRDLLPERVTPASPRTKSVRAGVPFTK